MDDSLRFWTGLGTQFANLTLFVVFLVLCMRRKSELKSLSETTNFIHLYPHKRLILIVLYLGAGLISTAFLGYCIYNAQKLEKQWWLEHDIQLWGAQGFGVCLDSALLFVQLRLMQFQLKKEQPYSPIHKFYWVSLFLIDASRMLIQDYSFSDLYGLAKLMCTSVLTFSQLLMLVYGVLIRPQDIPRFEKYPLFKLKSRSSMNSVFRNQETANFRLEKSGGSAGLNQQDGASAFIVDVVKIPGSGLLDFRTYLSSRRQLICRSFCSLMQFRQFYEKCYQSLNLRTHINFQNKTIHVEQVQEYISEVVSELANYEPFVFDFLQIPEHFKIDYRHAIEEAKKQRKMSGELEQQGTEESFDDYIFFKVRVYRSIRRRDNPAAIQYFMIVSNHLSRVQLRKSHNEIQGLHDALQSCEQVPRSKASTEEQSALYTPFIKAESRSKIILPEFPRKFDKDSRAVALDVQEYLNRLLNDSCLVRDSHQHSNILLGFIMWHEKLEDIPHNLPFHLSDLVFEATTTEHRQQTTDTSATGSGRKNTRLVQFFNFSIKLKNRHHHFMKISKSMQELTVLNVEVSRHLKNRNHPVETLPRPDQSKKQQKIISLHQLLAKYLNKLTKHKTLEDCYAWRQFLAVSKSYRKASQAVGMSSRHSDYRNDISGLIEDLRSNAVEI